MCMLTHDAQRESGERRVLGNAPASICLAPLLTTDLGQCLPANHPAGGSPSVGRSTIQRS